MKNLLVLFGLLFAHSAYAESVNVQLFRSPFNLNYGILESSIHDGLPWSSQGWQPKHFFSADYHYVKDPLVVINTTTNTRVRSLVNSVHTLDLAYGYFLNPGLSLYGQAPIHYSSIPGTSNKMDLGDLRFAAKQSLSERGVPLQFSLMPEIVLPSGNKTRFLSDDSLGLGLLLIAENDFGPFRLTGNFGYRRAGSATTNGIDYRNRIPLGLGAAIPLAPNWLLNAEASGALALPTAQRENASEFYLGANYQPYKYLAAIFGASVGSFDSEGSVNYRFQAALRTYFGEPRRVYEAPREEPAKEVKARPVPPPAPPPPPAPKPKARMLESKIEITEEIQFEHNKDRLTASAKEVLDEVAALIREHQKGIKRIVVEGHTSLVGTAPYNMKLSWKRARAVVSYLVKQKKIPAKLLLAKGYGLTRPKYHPGKASDAELALNRRVEFNLERLKK